MKAISFNINGLRARLHQLEAIITKHKPDVIGLQEIKVDNPQFPLEAVEALGYKVFYHGQKGHYGVALMTNLDVEDVQYGWEDDADDAQRRMIMATVTTTAGNKVRVLNGYFPQGESRDHETKFPAKMKFYEDLQHYLETNHTNDENVIVMGDINISPAQIDIGIGSENAKRWLRTGKCSFLPEEREWLARLKDWGLDDTYRLLHPETTERYSWFDYRSRGFDDNRGLRIDVILATENLSQYCVESDIDYELRGIEKPSDHAPIWSTFEF
jgi:exodeoxyribonuclease-3